MTEPHIRQVESKPILVALRMRNVRRAFARWTSRSKEYREFDGLQILDPWIYCRNNRAVVGRASAINIVGDELELVEPVWLSAPARMYVRHNGWRSRLLRDVPPELMELPQMKLFLAGKNRCDEPTWWRRGETPDEVYSAAVSEQESPRLSFELVGPDGDVL